MHAIYSYSNCQFEIDSNDDIALGMLLDTRTYVLRTWSPIWPRGGKIQILDQNGSLSLGKKEEKAEPGYHSVRLENNSRPARLEAELRVCQKKRLFDHIKRIFSSFWPRETL